LPADSPARLLIADDHDLVREGLRTMLAKEAALEVVGEAEDGRQAVQMCRTLRPDLVLMDVRMPGMDGLAATRAIKSESPRVSILMVTTHAEAEYLLEAVEAGAAGYVLKDSTKRELVDAVRKVLSGESALNQDLAMGLLRRLTGEGRLAAEVEVGAPARHPGPPIEPLTNHEIETLKLVAGGLTNKEIALQLFISTGTVKNRVQSIIAKLGVSDRTHATVRAIELGLLPLSSNPSL